MPSLFIFMLFSLIYVLNLLLSAPGLCGCVLSWAAVSRGDGQVRSAAPSLMLPLVQSAASGVHGLRSCGTPALDASQHGGFCWTGD